MRYKIGMNPFAKRQIWFRSLFAGVIVFVGLICFSDVHMLVLKDKFWWALFTGACGIFDLYLCLYWIRSVGEIIDNLKSGVRVSLTVDYCKDRGRFYLCKVLSTGRVGVIDTSKTYRGINKCLRNWTARVRGWGYHVEVI